MIVLDFLSDLWAVFQKYGEGDPTKGAVLVILSVSLLFGCVAAFTVETIDRIRDRKNA